MPFKSYLSFQVANAVGAALAQVSGTFDQVIVGDNRQKALERAKATAKSDAVKAGALADSIEIVECHETAVSYLPGKTPT